jgi:signal transduction histidine kinase
VLDFALARVKGGIPLEARSVDLAAVVQQLVADLEPASRARIAVTPTGDASGHWDPDRLAQVVTNLLSNAIEHGEKGGRVEVAVDGTDERSVALEVHNGGTVPRAALEVIFDPFKPRSSGSGGLGLGLYIVDQIVQAHGGSATVRSAEQDGTTFRIVLPRRPGDARATFDR